MENEEFIKRVDKFFEDIKEVLFSKEVAEKLLSGYDEKDIDVAITAIKYALSENLETFMCKWIRTYLAVQSGKDENMVKNRAAGLRKAVTNIKEKDFSRMGVYRKLIEGGSSKIDAAIDVAIFELSMNRINEEEGKYRKASAN